MNKVKRIGWIVLIISFPLLEASIFILLTSKIGAFKTFLLVIISTVIGIILDYVYCYLWENRLSWSTTAKDRVDKAVIGFIAFILFLIPGFLTDILGMMLIFPPTQQWFVARYRVFNSKLDEQVKLYKQNNQGKKKGKRKKYS